MLEELIKALSDREIAINADELSDALWLAMIRTSVEDARASLDPQEPKETPDKKPGFKEARALAESVRPPAVTSGESVRRIKRPKPQGVTAPAAPALAPTKVPTESVVQPSGLPFRVAAAPSLPQAMEIARAMRPLRRRARSNRHSELDENATADRVVEEGLWIPVLRPGVTRWLDVALVVDGAASMALWHRSILDFAALVRGGGFRDVRRWTLDSESPSGPLKLFGGSTVDGPAHAGMELVDPTKRRLIIVVTDGVARAWRDGRASALLRAWGARTATVILDVLPRNLWIGTVVGDGLHVTLEAAGPGAASAELSVQKARRRRRQARPSKAQVPFPLVELTPGSIRSVARVVAGIPGSKVGGITFANVDKELVDEPMPSTTVARTAAEGIAQFQSVASPTAQKLAQLLAASPLSLPVMRLVREVMLPEANMGHIAEVFLGGLIEQTSSRRQPDEVDYDFKVGIREELLRRLPVDESLAVLASVSRFVESRLGRAIDFPALLADPTGGATDWRTNVHARPFAAIAAEVLRPLGGKFRELADRLGPIPAGRTELRGDESGGAERESTIPEERRENVGENGYWVLVDGSEQSDSNESLGTVATHLGAELARAGFSVVTFGSAGIAELVARGFADVMKLTGYSTGRGRFLNVLPAGTPPEFDWGRTIAIETAKAKALPLAAVRRADAVVVFGESRHTRVVKEATRVTNMLVLNAFGNGDAAEEAQGLVKQLSKKFLLSATERESPHLALHIAELALDEDDEDRFEARLGDLKKELLQRTLPHVRDLVADGRRPSHRLAGLVATPSIDAASLLNALRAELRTVWQFRESRVLSSVLDNIADHLPLAELELGYAIAAAFGTLHEMLDDEPQADPEGRRRARMATIAERDTRLEDGIELARLARRSGPSRPSKIMMWLNQHPRTVAMPEADIWFASDHEGRRFLALGLVLSTGDIDGFLIVNRVIRRPLNAIEQFTALHAVEKMLPALDEDARRMLQDSLEAARPRMARMWSGPTTPWHLGGAILERLRTEFGVTSSEQVSASGTSRQVSLPSPVTWNRKRVLVVGAQGRVSAPIRSICKELGGQLAERGFALVCMHHEGVGQEVASAYAALVGSLLPEASGRNLVLSPNGVVDELEAHGLVEATDAVVVVSGADATKSIVNEALAARKLVLPLPATEGAAQYAFGRLRMLLSHQQRLTGEELRGLETFQGASLVVYVLALVGMHLIETRAPRRFAILGSSVMTERLRSELAARGHAIAGHEDNFEVASGADDYPDVVVGTTIDDVKKVLRASRGTAHFPIVYVTDVSHYMGFDDSDNRVTQLHWTGAASAALLLSTVLDLAYQRAPALPTTADVPSGPKIFARSFLRAMSAEETFRVAFDLVDSVVRADHAYILLTSKSAETDFRVASVSARDVRWKHARPDSAVRRCLTRGVPIRIDDVRAVGPNAPIEPNTLSSLAVPLVFDGETIGVIVCECGRPGQFQAYDEETLAQLGAALVGRLKALEWTPAEIDELAGATESKFHLEEMAYEYEHLRRTLPTGPTRTRRLTTLVNSIRNNKTLVELSENVVSDLFWHGRDGERVAALASCTRREASVPVSIVAEAIRAPRSRFEQWTALLAADEAVRRLHPSRAEPCVISVLQQLANSKSTINSSDDRTRVLAAMKVILRFSKRVGFGETDGSALENATEWIAGATGAAHVGQAVAIFGSDEDGTWTAFAQRLGERLWAHGWHLVAASGTPGEHACEAFERGDGYRGRARVVDSATLFEGVAVGVVIAGGEEARNQYVLALERKIPVLPLTFTTGAAQEVAKRAAQRLQSRGVPAAMLRLVETRGQDDEETAERIVRVLNRIAARAKTNRSR